MSSTIEQQSLKQRSGCRTFVQTEKERLKVNSGSKDEEDTSKSRTPRHHYYEGVSHLSLLGLFIVMLTVLYNATNLGKWHERSRHNDGEMRRDRAMQIRDHIFESNEIKRERRHEDHLLDPKKVLLEERPGNKKDKPNKDKDKVKVEGAKLQREGKEKIGHKTESKPKPITVRRKVAHARSPDKIRSRADHPKKGGKSTKSKQETREMRRGDRGTLHKNKSNQHHHNHAKQQTGSTQKKGKVEAKQTPKPPETKEKLKPKDKDKSQSSDDSSDDSSEDNNEDSDSLETTLDKGKKRTATTHGSDEKCTLWEISLDDWWQNHPTWEPSFENDTHACFRPIANSQRVQLVEKAHALQFGGCKKKPAIRHLFPMGFAATLLFHLNSAFWSAFRENRQFIPGIAWEGWEWLYEPTDKHSWAHCSTKDHECLFLPITDCPRPVGGKDEKPKKKYQFRELENNETLVEQNIWLAHYLMRPRQVFRKKMYEYMRDSKDMPTIQTPCTWIHVRRADAMTETNYKRNYYLLKEYLTRGEVSKDDNILLLTDDQSTIEEANLLHPEYKWTYWDRKRNRGPVPNNAHIPSGDQALEILTIMAETKLASQCQKGVFGNSNMAKLFRNAMAIEQPGGLQNLTLIQIDRRAMRKTRVEPEEFVKELDKQLDAARKKLLKQQEKGKRTK